MEVQGVEVTNVITGAKCNKGARCNTELVPNVIRNGSQGSLNYIIKGGGGWVTNLTTVAFLEYDKCFNSLSSMTTIFNTSIILICKIKPHNS